jgi:DNA replicative helicase MCM subunit Mcm2 (Cdc46/Mcm family)
LPRLKISINEIDNGFMVESNYGGAFDVEQGKTVRYVKTLSEAQELIGETVDVYVRLLEEAKVASKVRPVTLREKMKAILDTMTALAGGDEARAVSEEALMTALHGKYQSKEITALIGQLMRDGVIYSPKPNYLRRTASR